jgi:hypothetical protein
MATATLLTGVQGVGDGHFPASGALAPRTVTLTQTITNAGVVTTATVTLGRGSPPTESPPPPSRGSTDSDGLGPVQIGIIVGCCLGAFLLIGLVALFIMIRRRRDSREYYYDYDGYYGDGMSEFSSSNPENYWPPFPQSIPPPTVPEYTATVPAQRWTTYRTGKKGRRSHRR